MRHINAAGLALLKEFEGCKLTAYPDPATGGDPWTIGYGSTGPHVKRGVTITQAEAERLLLADLDRFEQAVTRYVTVPLTQNQFDALVSFTYNCGQGSLQTSTLLRKLNAGDYAGAQGQFARWNRAGGKEMAGLTRRRAAEAELFGTPDAVSDA